MPAKRPTCAYCGKPYGQRSTTMEVVKWGKDEAKPEYKGNSIVVKDHYHGFSGGKSSAHGVDTSDRHVAYRTIWDGVPSAHRINHSAHFAVRSPMPDGRATN